MLSLNKELQFDWAQKFSPKLNKSRWTHPFYVFVEKYGWLESLVGIKLLQMVLFWRTEKDSEFSRISWALTGDE